MKFVLMSFICTAAVLCTEPAPASERNSGERPERVVSLNLCTDELLLLLADEEQMTSVTWLVKDPALSWYAAAASAVPANRGLAEDIVRYQPDLVLAGKFTTPSTLMLLEYLGIPLLRLDMPTDLTSVEEQIITVAQTLGHAERGLEVVEDMRARLAALPVLPGGSKRLTAALYQPNGLTATEDSLVHAALDLAGLRNLAVIRRLPSYARLPMETLLFDEPDVLVLNHYAQKMPSLAQELMRHPALTRSFSRARTVVVPAQSWTCGTPYFIHAVETLRQAALTLEQNK